MDDIIIIGNLANSLDLSVLKDTKLSWRAKGLLCYLLANAKGQKIFCYDLYESSSDKKWATKSILVELMHFNYIHRFKVQEEKHSGEYIYSRWRYLVFSVPTEIPASADWKDYVSEINTLNFFASNSKGEQNDF